ncbi:MAG: AbrB/MazE/SpoVT family DNA-binding domain-containing protein [Nitrospirae bacterium]|nr:AbrB/MazE/SpoVT family DNA-binding domain-containing protein [Nitrospirota bacterium]MBI3351914.1 AbrB/MazE/SpoVT family DNA-binding domain-containing protein [Nitrospirota bacterium]
MPTAQILAKGQIVIPKELREKAHLSQGDKVDVRWTKKGIVISPIRKTHTLAFRGIVKGKLSLDDLESLDAEKS